MSPAIKYSNIELEDSEQKYFLLSNKHGGFLTISNNLTNFQGWIEREEKYLKLIDKINYEGKLTKIKNNYDSIEEIYEENTLKYELFENGIKIELKKNSNISIDLDVRRIYRNPKEGRIYDIKKELNKDKNELTITYSKFKTDQLNELEYKKHITISGINNKNKISSEWVKKEYEYDKRRNSSHIYYVYRIKNVNTKNLAISYSDNLKESIDKSHFLYHHNIKPNYLFKIKDKRIKNNYLKINHELLDLAYKNAYDGIRKLAFQENNNTFFYAGHPWFFQTWTRDVLTSLSGIKKVDYKSYENLIFLLNKILNKHGMKNIIEFKHHKITNLEIKSENKDWIINADSIGWYAKRIKDYLEEKIKNKEEVDYKFLKEILFKFSNHIKETIIQGNEKNKIKYLKMNKPKQTWMDTIKRDGYRIEIQAQLITIYDLVIFISNYLGKKDLKLEMEYFKEKSIKQIKKYFIKDKKIVDGFNIKNTESNKNKINKKRLDFTPFIRPNVFLAYYINKEIFEKEIWENTFDEVLENNVNEFKIEINKEKNHEVKFSLISTVQYDKAIKHYSGTNDESYHMGDSWYFINNIACIALYKLNKKKYKNYINKIINSSIYDCTINNSFCSEVSSIDEIKPYGCYNQLWSNATLIELLELIEEK